MSVQELGAFKSGGGFRKGFTPLVYEDNGEIATNESGYVVVENSAGMRTNSLLRKDEWESLDNAVLQAARTRLVGIQRLQDRGLTKNLDSIGIMTTQWNKGSEMTRATVNMSGQTAMDRDRQDYNLTGVPVPVIHKAFRIGERDLEASRRLGEGIDTTNAYEASRVVAEELERMLYDGNSDINLNGDTISGLKDASNTGTADGDFDTLSNIHPTITAMVNAAQADNYFGPYELFIYKTQYNEMLDRYTDGSGETPLDGVLRIPDITAVHSVDYLSDGELVLLQMTPNVIDLAVHSLNQMVEWTSDDGMTHSFKVMSIAVPRVKSDYSGGEGIVYYTGA